MSPMLTELLKSIEAVRLDISVEFGRVADALDNDSIQGISSGNLTKERLRRH
jgi:hypothetical protein